MEFPLEDDGTEAPAADDATPTSDEVGGVSDADLATCVRVLTALGADDAEFHSPRCKSLRVAMQPFLEDIRGKLFHGQAVDKYRQRQEAQYALWYQQHQRMLSQVSDPAQRKALSLELKADRKRKKEAAKISKQERLALRALRAEGSGYRESRRNSDPCKTNRAGANPTRAAFLVVSPARFSDLSSPCSAGKVRPAAAGTAPRNLLPMARLAACSAPSPRRTRSRLASRHAGPDSATGSQGQPRWPGL